MTDLKLVAKEGAPDPEDKQALVNGMLSFHKVNGHIRKVDDFSIFLKDENNKPFGGIIVSFLFQGMYISALWVDESQRGQGWGTKLMEAAEEEAKKRGCTVSYTDTFSWQAPEFYEKLGYTEYGKLEDFPKGNSLTYFCKYL